MSRWGHVLTDIDMENRSAICEKCGYTHIYIRPDGEAVCGTYRWQDEEDRHNRSQMKVVIEKMGGKCESCGFDDWRTLQVDHKTGTGGARQHTYIIYAHILQGHTSGYQLLCANCNAIKASERNERVGCYDSLDKL